MTSAAFEGLIPEGSPLVLCDSCPRAYHLECLRGVDASDLPGGDWACPRCGERRGATLRRLVDFETRQHEALERCVDAALCLAVCLMRIGTAAANGGPARPPMSRAARLWAGLQLGP